MARVRWRNKIFDPRTARMAIAAEKRSGLRFTPSQGSFSHAAASAGTHSGPGAMDLSISGWNRRQIDKATKVLREVGFSAWYRTRADGFPGEHIHAIANGTKGLPPVAAAQVRSAAKGHNGLRGNGLDRQAYLNVKPTTWEKYLANSGVPHKSTWPLRGLRQFGWRAGTRGPVKLTLRDNDPGILKINEKLLNSASSDFTKNTFDAVKKVQAAAGLKETGIVNKATWDVIFP